MSFAAITLPESSIINVFSSEFSVLEITSLENPFRLIDMPNMAITLFALSRIGYAETITGSPVIGDSFIFPRYGSFVFSALRYHSEASPSISNPTEVPPIPST